MGLGFGLIPAVVSYLLYMGGLGKGLEVSKVSVIAYVETVVATLIDVFISNESIGVIKVLGIFVLIFSIAMMNSKDESVDVINEGV